MAHASSALALINSSRGHLRRGHHRSLEARDLGVVLRGDAKQSAADEVPFSVDLEHRAIVELDELAIDGSDASEARRGAFPGDGNLIAN